MEWDPQRLAPTLAGVGGQGLLEGGGLGEENALEIRSTVGLDLPLPGGLRESGLRKQLPDVRGRMGKRGSARWRRASTRKVRPQG